MAAFHSMAPSSGWLMGLKTVSPVVSPMQRCGYRQYWLPVRKSRAHRLCPEVNLYTVQSRLSHRFNSTPLNRNGLSQNQQQVGPRSRYREDHNEKGRSAEATDDADRRAGLSSRTVPLQ